MHETFSRLFTTARLTIPKTSLAKAWAVIFVTVCWTNLVATALAAVKTSPAEPAKTEISSITAAMVDTSVDIQGIIKAIHRPGEGSRAPFRVQIADDTGSINLIIWQDSFEVVQTRTGLAVGDTISVRGKVSEFRGEVQVTLRDVENLQVVSKGSGTAPDASAPDSTANRPEPAPTAAPTPPAGTTPVASLDRSKMGQIFTVQATVTNIREPRSERAPYIVTLEESGATIQMVYWSDTAPAVASKVRVGNTLRVRAKLEEFKGTLQLRLGNANDIELVTAGSAKTQATPTPPPAPVAAAGPVEISRITPAMEHQTVIITGTIEKSEPLGKGRRLGVKDATGTVRVILWEKVLGQLPADKLEAGTRVTVTGRVQKYRDSLEVVPDSAADVKILGQ